MNIPDLILAFQVLPVPTDTGSVAFSTSRIGSNGAHHLGKDIWGAPALLLATLPSNRPVTGIRLSHLSVDHNQECSIETSVGGVTVGNFTVVRCRPNDPTLYTPFLRIIAPIIVTLGSSPTQRQTNLAVSEIVKLFRSLSVPPAKSIQGVWAELLVIEQSSDPIQMLAAWHGDPLEQFDFANGLQRVEVKSSSRETRTHHFSLNQLSPKGAATIYIASVFVQRSTGGMSLEALMDRIRSSVSHDPELTSKLYQIVFSSLGSAYQSALSDAFDYELAISTLRFYRASDIPTIPSPLPPTVSNVHFIADLSHIAPVDTKEMTAQGSLLAACIPVTRP